MLLGAAHVRLSATRDRFEKLRTLSWPMERWKEQYRCSVPRFHALTACARAQIEAHHDANAVVQVGAWFSSSAVTRLPCFSYHDTNAALGYRYYGRGLLSDSRRREHLQWEHDVYAGMRGVFVMSSWLASSFHTDFGVPLQNIHVVGAGVNTGRLPDIPVRDFSVPRFLFVGKDFVRKGGQYLLNAFAEVKRKFANAELIIVGPSLSLDQAGVRSLGFLSHANAEHVAQLHQLFLSATTVVLPSVYEPFGISLLEGMAFALPGIATNRCAMPEIVRHRETGLIVEAENVAALAEAMLEIAGNPRAAREMGLAGRTRVESDFTWDAVARKIKGILVSSVGP